MTYANARLWHRRRSTARLPKLALAAGLLTSASLPAFAADLNFDATCQNPTAISVSQPNTGITFRKNPNSSTTRAATATVQRGTARRRSISSFRPGSYRHASIRCRAVIVIASPSGARRTSPTSTRCPARTPPEPPPASDPGGSPALYVVSPSSSALASSQSSSAFAMAARASSRWRCRRARRWGIFRSSGRRGACRWWRCPSRTWPSALPCLAPRRRRATAASLSEGVSEAASSALSLRPVAGHAAGAASAPRSDTGRGRPHRLHRAIADDPTAARRKLPAGAGRERRGRWRRENR